MPDESVFLQRSGDTLERLAEAIESADDAGVLEIDYMDGVLNIETDDGAMWVVNRHRGSGQVWLSSPVSGAWHFDYDEASGQWGTKGQELEALLLGELLLRTGVKVASAHA